MSSDGFFAAFGAAPTYVVSLFSLLYLFGSVCVFVSLIRQIGARTSAPIDGPTKAFGLPEAILAGALILFLLLNIAASVSRPSVELSARNLFANLLFTMFVVLLFVIFLTFGGFFLSLL